jgi:hypothetical protein
MLQTSFRRNHVILRLYNIKMAVFWLAAPCILVEVYRRFRVACCLHHQALMMEAASTSETSVNFYQTTWHYNPEDSHLHSRRCENLKSHAL